MKKCFACGMPLEHEEDFANSDLNSDFCQYCVNADGSVKSCEQIFKGGVDFFMHATGCDQYMAEKVTRKNMKSLPYWQNETDQVLQGEVATDEEFAEAMSLL